MLIVEPLRKAVRKICVGARVTLNGIRRIHCRPEYFTASLNRYLGEFVTEFYWEPRE